jgi:hypothetical protein
VGNNCHARQHISESANGGEPKIRASVGENPCVVSVVKKLTLCQLVKSGTGIVCFHSEKSILVVFLTSQFPKYTGQHLKLATKTR